MFVPTKKKELSLLE